MRVAWFSPMPPVRTGIAAVSAELVPALAHEHAMDVYTDTNAYDFVWQHRQNPYDVTVYQIGNSSHHDYIWPYLFRYPGLTVLHDAHLHHARAATLLRTRRVRDYRAEFAANHPDASPDLAELAVAGFDNHLYYFCPMTRLVVEASKMTAVHAPALAASLRGDHPAARIGTIQLAHGEPIPADRARAARSRVRARHGIPDDSILFGVFGGLTPEKRIPQILDALAAVLPYAPDARLLLAGAAARHFDAAAAVRDRGLDGHVTMPGYVPEETLSDYLASCDVSINVRWPTAREMSGPWLRALAAGLPTITTDLAHLADVPSLDPRTWATRPGSGLRDPGSGMSPGSGIRDPGSGSEDTERARASRIPHPGSDPGSRIPDPVTIAVDILDEDHSLRLAMRRLATDANLRASLGANARAYWEREHSMPRMLEGYRWAIAETAAAPAPFPALPSHLVDDGDATLRTLLARFGISGEQVFLR